jgi:CheY-like chemotaxis protein
MTRLAEDPARQTMSVLLVEDNDDIRFLLRFWLESDDRCGSVWEAASPAEAIEQARSRQLDVMIVDYMLTGGTALDCLAELRRLRPQAWIVVYTANRAVAIQAGVLSMGADVLLEKVQVVVEDVVELALSPDRRAS